MRILHTKDGQPLVKAVTLKVFEPGNKHPHKFVHRAPARQGFTSDGMEHILLKTADLIEKKYPNDEFRLVPIGPAAFNFVHAGEKHES